MGDETLEAVGLLKLRSSPTLSALAGTADQVGRGRLSSTSPQAGPRQVSDVPAGRPPSFKADSSLARAALRPGPDDQLLSLATRLRSTRFSSMPLISSSTQRSASPLRRSELPLSPLLPPSSLRPSLSSRSSVSRLTPLHPQSLSPTRPRSPSHDRPHASSLASAPLFTRRQTADPTSQCRPALLTEASRGSQSNPPSNRRRRPERDAFTLEVRVGRFIFRPDDVLGRGSFGTVYAGLEEATRRPVAIKLEP